MQHNLRVRSRREDGALAFQSLSLFGGEGEVAVVADGDLSLLSGDEEGVRLGAGDFACGRVARVADGGGAGQTVQTLFVEDLADEPHRALGAVQAVGGDEGARRLSAARELG